MNSVPESVLNDIVPIIAIMAGVLVALVAIVSGAVQKVWVARAREQTRREIAAYVAEGTVSPDDAVRMLNAGKSAKDCLTIRAGAKA